MRAQSQFKLTTPQVRQRLTSILDHHFQYLADLQLRHPKRVLVLNQSLLEEWQDLLDQMVHFRDQKTIHTAPTKVTGQLKDQHEIKPISCIPPKPTQDSQDGVLLNIYGKNVDIFQIKRQLQKGGPMFISQKSQLQFKKGTVHRFCSYSCCDDQNVVLIGGCRESSPNLKSHDVLNLNLVSKEIVKIGELPYGLSSHAAIRIQHKVYVVGGNKNFNIVTRKCLQFDLMTKTITNITDLNYPSASHTLLDWKQSFIYKFGGIGSCFGEWDLSPYIERYDISQDNWEVVNPSIKINQSLLHHYSLLVNSLAYVSNRQSIVIMGGYDFSQKGSNKVFEIEVREELREQGVEYVHEIVTLGLVSSFLPGGFISQQTVIKDGNLFALEAIEQPKTGLGFAVVSLAKEVAYLS